MYNKLKVLKKFLKLFTTRSLKFFYKKNKEEKQKHCQ